MKTVSPPAFAHTNDTPLRDGELSAGLAFARDAKRQSAGEGVSIRKPPHV